MTHGAQNILPFPKPLSQPSQFEALWQIWPRRERKLVAKAKYDAILRGCKTRTLDKDSGQYVDIDLSATEDEILAGAVAYLKSQKATGSGSFGYIDGGKAYILDQIDKRTYRLKDDGKFIPYLSTWLNGGRFMDLL